MPITEIDLSNYVRVGRYDLPSPSNTTPPDGTSLLAQEASSVTYNWDTNTLFVVGDGGTSVVQVSLTGQLINSMTLASGSSPQGTTFYDTEGITYVGNGQFVMTEERDRQVVLFTYAPGTTLTRGDVSTVDLGTNIGNVGLEGVTYDPQTGGYILVKEKTPEGVFQTGIDFVNHTATNGSSTTDESTNLFDPAKLGTSDVSDVYALSNVAALNGHDDSSHLLIISQESGKVVEVDRDGNVLSSLTIQTDPGDTLSVADMTMEGVTMGPDGTLYIVNENGGGNGGHPQLWVYAPTAATNQAPTAVALTNQTTSIAENTDTTSRIKVANVAITDDGLGTNHLSVSGADAQYFEVDATGLYIKAGTVLDFETKNSYAVTVNVDDPNVGTTPDASTNFNLSLTDVVNETPSHPSLVVSEVAPWSSGNSPLGADWFELTNTGTTALDITGWKMDDNSDSFGSAVSLSGITSIAPGESVIFIETSNLAAAKTAFINLWFGGNAPAGLQIGSYSGSGVGLSTGGDHVNIYDASGAVKASVAFGASPTGPYPTFDNWAGVNDLNTPLTTATAGVHGAAAAAQDASEIGSPGSDGKLFISEVAPWSSGSPVGADWFEVTNTTAFDIDVTGWKMDDNSQSFALGASLSGISTIHAGESVIFLEGDATARTAFINTWFAGHLPAGVQVGTYSGSGVGLSTSSDQVNLYDGNGVLRSSVAFGASTTNVSFDNAAGVNGITTPLTQLSAVGVNGGTHAANDANETGSPGAIANAVNHAPTAVALNNQVNSIAENTTTATHIKVADVAVTDDGLGTNTLSLSGADAAFFEVDATGLYIKAGTVLDFETKASYAVTVNVDDTTVGATPDASTNFNLSLTDTAEGAPHLVISEVAAWSSSTTVGADWFEVTNTGTADANIAGWKMDDNSNSFGSAVALSGITTIHAGESVIFFETSNLAATKAAFINLWFGGNAPAGLQFGSYSGSGVGLSTSGDAVNLFNASGALQANVSFGASPSGPLATFDNAAGLNNTTISQLSTVGTHGAAAAANDSNEIGSPGTIVNVNHAPSAVTLDNTLGSIAENTATADHIFVGDIHVTDDALGSNTLGLTGADAAFFEIVGTQLFLKAGTVLDFEAKASYAVAVTVDDPSLGATPDATSTTYTLNVGDVTGSSITGTNAGELIDATHTVAGQPLPSEEPDSINGRGGDDTISGLGGNDVIVGGAGADTMYGGTGNDRYRVDNAGDHVIELAGQGTDTVFASVSYALDAGSEVEVLRAAAGSTGIALTGNELNNIVIGGDGDDTITGGGGRDLLTGGAGHDTFVFTALADSAAGAARDKIADFVEGVDKIDLSAIDAVQGTPGDDGFHFVGAGGLAHAGDLRVGTVNGNTMISADVNGDHKADFQILLSGVHTLTASDFIL